jgi:asparagine synthetase B (glutamine-hydrolysing)
MTCITKLRMSKGTKHTEFYLTPSDSSQIPTYLISRLATKQRDSEAVGAGGGDELFGEYNRYILTRRS